jgi:hypothetical protein
VAEDDKGNSPVKAKAFLVDPGTLDVLWMNEAASLEAGAGAGHQEGGIPLEEAFPISKDMGLLEELPAVAESGRPRHLETNLISSKKGDMTVVASAYRLPDGKVLILSDLAWHGKRRR